jgi:cytochrome c oxidase cbb3-type subunit II
LGEAVYAREGCAQCHTQMIRPAQIALDGWIKGAGENQDPRPPTPVRSNVLRDYLGEKYAFLGIQRNGPDLTNAGHRFAVKRDQLHLHLYAPRQLNNWSNAPSHSSLYTVRKAQGQKGSSEALKLEGPFAPPAGFEIVPTDEANAVVDYLLSLKRDALIPGTTVASAPAAGAAPAKK